MKVAYLIIAHTDIKQLNRLIKRLINTGDVYIHLDAKSNININEIESNSDKIHILSKRINVAWAGFSVVLCQKILLEEAINSKNKYDRYIILSGLDYPIYSDNEILTYFVKNKNIEYVCGYNITKCNNIKQLYKIKYYHLFRDIPLKHNSIIRRAIIVGSRILLMCLGLRKKTYIKINNERWNIYFGSNWIGLTDKCAKYVLNQLNTNNKLIKYFKTSYAPDELCIQTIVFNSPYASNAIYKNKLDFQELTPLHYLNYTDHIWSYDENDYNTIIMSDKMFVRKLVSNQSEKLIDLLDSKSNINE